jgi:hypothetical protein
LGSVQIKVPASELPVPAVLCALVAKVATVVAVVVLAVIGPVQAVADAAAVQL